MINLREWALPVYTIMMQMAAGTMLVYWLGYIYILRREGSAIASKVMRHLLLVIMATVGVAMIGSHYHLSRPLFSIFAVMNIKSSWLSREVTFTIIFMVLVGVLLLLQLTRRGTVTLHLALGGGASLTGIATVYSMSQVYLVPTQSAWNMLATPVAFFSTMFLLGSLALIALLMMNLYMAALRQDDDLDTYSAVNDSLLAWLVVVIVAAVCIEFAAYGFQVVTLQQGNVTARASLDLLLGLYGTLFTIRLGLLGLGTLLLVGSILWRYVTRKPLVALFSMFYVVFAAVLISEVLGRFLFYAIHVRTGI